MRAAADNMSRENYRTIDFEETELRLGLPGGGNEGPAVENNVMSSNNGGKRGFSETESSSCNNTTIDLKLNLSTTLVDQSSKVEKNEEIKLAAKPPVGNNNNDPAKPPAAKAQVVGWPPVRSYRKNIMSTAAQKTTSATTSDEKKMTETNVTAAAAGSSGGAAFVKVSLDGAPYLRKVDLKLYKSYNQLSEALGKMFSSFTIDNCGSQGTKDFMNESKLIDLLNGSEYVPTYEDKDGDWMLVGDIPWGVFVDSCKRLRIMKGSEAIGLAPRAVEKCKNRC